MIHWSNSVRSSSVSSFRPSQISSKSDVALFLWDLLHNVDSIKSRTKVMGALFADSIVWFVRVLGMLLRTSSDLFVLRVHRGWFRFFVGETHMLGSSCSLFLVSTGRILRSLSRNEFEAFPDPFGRRVSFARVDRLGWSSDFSSLTDDATEGDAMTESALCCCERRLYFGALDEELMVSSVHRFVLALLRPRRVATGKSRLT